MRSTEKNLQFFCALETLKRRPVLMELLLDEQRLCATLFSNLPNLTLLLLPQAIETITCAKSESEYWTEYFYCASEEKRVST